MKTVLLLFLCLNLYSQEKNIGDNLGEDYHQYLAKYFLEKNPVLDTKLHYVTLSNEFQVNFVWDGMQVDSITFVGEICNYFIEPITKAVIETSDFWQNPTIGQVKIFVPFSVSVNSPLTIPFMNTCKSVIFPIQKPVNGHQVLFIPKMVLGSTY